MSRREETIPELADTLAARSEDTLATASGDSAVGRSTTVTAGTKIGRYELRSRLGAGAMGEVWEAYDPQLDRQVAIKLVHPRVANSPEIAARMAREARAMAKVSHRAVVTVYDAGEEDDQLFLAMELVRGRSLGAVLRSRSPEERADWRRWLQVMIDAGHGLAAAHEAGVLHRDFKPDNVLVDERGRVCVGDFGLASLGDRLGRASRPVLATPVENAELTETGTLLGTPAYMSREQMLGDEVDARADQFSFCIATYEALYGERPFALPSEAQANLGALLDAIDRGAFREAPPDSRVPHHVRAALLRGLAVDPADRWPTMSSLLAELESALAPLDATARVPRHRRRSPYRLWTFLVIPAVAVAIAIFALRGHEPTAPGRAPLALPNGGATTQLTARFVRTLGTRTIFTISPSGSRAFGTNRLDVEVAGEPTPRRYTVPPTNNTTLWADHLQFEGDNLLHWSSRNLPRVYTWDLGGHDAPVQRTINGSVWFGRVLDGDLVAQKQPDGTYELRYVHGDQTVEAWTVPELIEVLSVSPDRRRVAYIDTVNRTSARFVVLDIATGTRAQGEVLLGLTALAWRTNESLLYAAGSPAAIHEVSFRDASFGTPHVIYEPHIEWLGTLAANETMALYTNLSWTTRGRILSTGAPAREFDPAQVASVLGWRDDTRFVAWNRTTHQLELRDPNLPGEPLSLELVGEPQNATLANGILIVSLRGAAGRSIAAFDVDHGKKLWTKAEGEVFAVRCAGDRAAPCLAAKRLPGDSERYSLVPIEPDTGALGTTVRYEGALTDFAVHTDGNRLAILPGAAHKVVEVTGSTSRVRTTDVALPRTVAFQTGDAIVIGGTGEHSLYVVRVEAENQPPQTLQLTDSEMVVLVRPSNDGRTTLVMTRTYQYDLWELPLVPGPPRR